jgi:hypothetical protein
VPRFAVRLLLALVLCLNGFFAPVAMAVHADPATAVAQKAPPCHGDEAPVDSASAGHAGQDGLPSCCKPGHCMCACVFSVSLPFAAGTGPVGRSQEVPLPRSVVLPPARDAVPLRPPIV